MPLRLRKRIGRASNSVAMRILSEFLGRFLDKFKIANPLLFLAVQFTLLMLILGVYACEGFFDFCALEPVVKNRDIIAPFLLVLFGINSPRTSRFIESKV